MNWCSARQRTLVIITVGNEPRAKRGVLEGWRLLFSRVWANLSSFSLHICGFVAVVMGQTVLNQLFFSSLSLLSEGRKRIPVVTRHITAVCVWISRGRRCGEKLVTLLAYQSQLPGSGMCSCPLSVGLVGFHAQLPCDNVLCRKPLPPLLFHNILLIASASLATHRLPLLQEQLAPSIG